MHVVLDNPAAVHPELWRATQLAVGHTRIVAWGMTGWPRGALTEY